MRVGRPSRVERDVPPFRIFLLVLKGLRTPKELSLVLNVTMATIVFHLRRLRRRGFLKYSEKRGRWQPYEPNWETLTRFFVTVVSARYAISELKPETPIFPSLDTLARNRYLQELVKAGLRELANSPPSTILNLEMSLEDFFRDFKEALNKIEIKFPRETADPDFQTFKAFLKMIKNELRLKKPGDYDWVQAMKKLGLVPRKKFRAPSEVTK